MFLAIDNWNDCTHPGEVQAFLLVSPSNTSSFIYLFIYYLYTNVYSHFIHNSPKLQTTQMSFMRWS